MPHTWHDLSPEDRESLGVVVTDAFALAAAGRFAPGMAEVRSTLSNLAPGELPVPWQSESADALGGAFLVSALIHAWDFDDTHDSAVVHCMTVALPSALFTALKSGRSGVDFLNGVIAAIQLHVRLSEAVGPKPGVIRTAGLGSIASAFASAVVLGHDSPANAVSLALPVSMSPASRQAVSDSSLLKRIQPAYTVRAGMTAAYLSDHGMAGPENWLSGDFGIMPGTGNSLNEILTGPWAGAELALKPYPSCRYNHEAIAAAIGIVRQIGVRGDDPIEEIVVRVPAGSGYSLVARPFAERGEPVIDAQFSLPWQIAQVFVTGTAEVSNLLEENLHNPAIAELAARVVVVQDLPESVAMGSALVDVMLSSGTSYSASSEGGSSVSRWDAVRHKVASCLELAFGGSYSPDHLYASVRQLSDMSSADLRAFITDLPIVK